MTEVDENLPGQDAPGLRRGTRILLVVGVAVLAVVGLVVAVRHGSDDRPRAVPTLTSTPSVPIPTTGLDRTGVSEPVSPCDETGGGLSCRVSIGVPANVVTAIRSVFPGTRVANSYTVTGRDRRLFVRRLNIVGGDRQVTLVIGVSDHSTRRYAVRRKNTRTLTSYESPAPTDAQRLQVRIDVVDRRGRAGIDRASLDGLAHDPRLLALL